MIPSHIWISTSLGAMLVVLTLVTWFDTRDATAAFLAPDAALITVQADAVNTQSVVTMTLTSPVFHNNALIPADYTCDGTAGNPPLEFADVPDTTKSFALMLEDPDVPRRLRSDGMWNHWVVWNLPVKIRTIQAGVPPTGVYGSTTSDTKGYYPPCPPDGQHRYIFTLYALDTVLDLTPGSSKQQLRDAMQGHILDTAQLIGLYER